jgi:hypothetical protein
MADPAFPDFIGAARAPPRPPATTQIAEPELAEIGRTAASHVAGLGTVERVKVTTDWTGSHSIGSKTPRRAGAPSTSAIRLPLRVPCRSGEKHAVMYEAKDLDHAVRRHSVDDQMPGFADPMLASHEAARRPEVERPDPRNLGNFARTGQGRRVANGGHGGNDEAVVTGGRVNAPSTRALEKDGVDPILGAADQAVGHLVLVGCQSVA